jgi:hypothetical protein
MKRVMRGPDGVRRAYNTDTATLVAGPFKMSKQINRQYEPLLAQAQREHADDVAALAAMVDRIGLESVLEALVEVCNRHCNHDWDQAAVRLLSAAASTAIQRVSPRSDEGPRHG